MDIHRTVVMVRHMAALGVAFVFLDAGPALGNGKMEPPDGAQFPVVAGQVEIKLQSERHSSPFREFDRNEHFLEGEGSAGLFLDDPCRSRRRWQPSGSSGRAPPAAASAAPACSWSSSS
jgi:hypothetical protein